MSGTSGALTGTTVGSTMEVGEPNNPSCSTALAGSVWYKFTATAAGTLRVSGKTNGATGQCYAVFLGSDVRALTLIAGSSFVTAPSISVATDVAAVAGTTYNVQVSNTNAAAASSFDVGWAFTPTAVVTPPATPVSPQTGYWWNPGQPGNGYTIEVAANRLLFVAYIYRPDGTAVWYFSNGPVTQSDRYSGQLFEVRGGRSLTSPVTNVTAAGDSLGTVQLLFSDATTGQIILPSGETIQITRFVP